MTDTETPPAETPAPSAQTPVTTLAEAIRTEIGRAIIGQDDTVHLMLVALLARGHILLEGVPGTAKTFLAQCFARACDLDYGRIQFTPDLLPGDLLGTNIYSFKDSAFNLVKGPIFTDLLLADEINRTPPKTQAALLEAMQERQVSIDGEPFDLGENFMVIATQNPIEQQGTYPLPEAQLDRFLLKHVLTYPSREQEIEIVMRHGNRMGTPDPEALGVKAVLNRKTLGQIRELVANVRLSDDVAHYIVDLVRGTRDNPLFETGASPRAAAMLAAAARANAALAGRDYVLPDDVKAIALPALRHRAILSATAEIEGRSAEALIGDVVEQTAAPR